MIPSHDEHSPKSTQTLPNYILQAIHWPRYRSLFYHQVSPEAIEWVETLYHLVNSNPHLYGTWAVRSTSALITRPSVKSDWLIMPASLALSFTAPDLPMFSDPAKSTRLSFPILITSSPSGVTSLICTVIEKMQCERDEVSFILVA